MRYVEGSDLRSLLDEVTQLESDRALHILEQVARALDAAHEHGLVHRDVKPGNILLTEEGDREHVYLSDFGLTKRTHDEGSLTQSEHHVGTLDYVSPEQINGEEPDRRADQYSLGCVLYECLTGGVPYRSSSTIGVLFAHLQKPPPSLTEKRPELPKEIDSVLARAMAKRPEERYRTCAEFLVEARSALRVGAAVERPAPLPRLSRRRLAPLLALAFVLVAAAIAVPLLLLMGGDDSGAASTVALDSVSVQQIDPETNELVATVPIQGFTGTFLDVRNARVNWFAVTEDAVWVIARRARALVRIDPQTHSVTTFGLPAPPTSIAATDEALWITTSLGGTGSLLEFSVPLGTVTREFDIALSDPAGVSITDESLWIAGRDPDGSAVVRLAPTTGETVARIPVPQQPSDIAAGENAVWVTSGHTVDFGSHALWRIDPATNRIVRETPIEHEVRSVATSTRSVWISESVGGVTQLDPETGEVLGTIPFEGEATLGVDVGEDAVWVVGGRGGTVSRIDPNTREVLATIDVGDFANTVAVGAGAVWVLACSDPCLEANFYEPSVRD